VRYLAAEAGIRQFPRRRHGHTLGEQHHEVAQAAAADSRIVYVDNDLIVLTRARALLAGGPAGSIQYIDGDLRDSAAIVEAAKRTLDFTRPIALMLLGILHLIQESEDLYQIVAGLAAGLSLRSLTPAPVPPPPAHGSGARGSVLSIRRRCRRCRRRRCGLPLSPPADHFFLIDQRHEYGRAQRDTSPFHDALVKLGDRVTDLLLGAQVTDALAEPCDLLAQLQRGRQELIDPHALLAQLVTQPGQAVIRFSAVRKRLAGAGQVFEGPPLRRLLNLLVNPRGKAHPRRFALGHPDRPRCPASST
jgi:hypothetical protein